MTALDANLSEYRLQDEERGIVGPVGLETVFDLIEAGVVAKTARASRDGGAFQPLSAFDEFAEILDKEGAAAPTASWNLTEKSMVRLLFELYLSSKTGLVVIRDGELRKDIYVRDGVIIFLSSNVPSERFGRFLINRGRLDQHEMEVALASMHTDKNRLGETLIRLGLLDEADLDTELREHHLERLIELCCWSTGHVEIFGDKEFEGTPLDLQLKVPELILRAIREMPEQMLAPLLETNMPARPTIVDTDALDPFHFSELECRIVDEVDGKKTFEEIAAVYGPDTDERRATLAVLYLLLALDLVVLSSD